MIHLQSIAKLKLLIAKKFFNVNTKDCATNNPKNDSGKFISMHTYVQMLDGSIMIRFFTLFFF